MTTTPSSQRNDGSTALQGTFRVEMLGTQESLDQDSSKFYTVCLYGLLRTNEILTLLIRSIYCDAHGLIEVEERR